MSELRHFVYILGPTATGKSELAMNVAKALSWPILNCDSVQTYKYVDIGTAKPSIKDRQEVPHYLFDYVEPQQKLNAADYLRDVLDVLKGPSLQNVLFVGGSGFYVQALEKGLYPDAEIPGEVKEKIQAWIHEKGFEDLYKWLQEKDGDFAAKISVQDHYRIRRAVEVMHSQNLNMTQLKQKMAEEAQSPLPHHKKLKVGLRLEKVELRERVEIRTQKMLEQGFVAEVESLVAQGFAQWAPMQSVGYKEVQLHLGGDLPETELFERIVTSTMQLIKKQMTWFKRDPEILWFSSKEKDKAQDVILSWSRGEVLQGHGEPEE